MDEFAMGSTEKPPFSDPPCCPAIKITAPVPSGSAAAVAAGMVPCPWAAIPAVPSWCPPPTAGYGE